MKLLDLFCGAGGAAMGYYRAGFQDITGVDNKPQKRYPFKFVLADALEYLEAHGHEYDVIHASPPCQKFSAMRKGRWQDREHPDLLEPTRGLLQKVGKTYIIENVPGAPLIDPIMLCGTLFGLQTKEGNQLRRHRLFECSFWPGIVPVCRHNDKSAIGVYGGGQHPARRKRGRKIELITPQESDFGIKARKQVMGIDWMVGKELNEAIPPAYTEWLGKRILEAMNA